jgi:hypothetical protein
MGTRDKPYPVVAQFAALALHAAELQQAARETPSRRNAAAATHALRGLTRAAERICRLFRLDTRENLTFCFVLLAAGCSAYCLYLYLSQLEEQRAKDRVTARMLMRT